MTAYYEALEKELQKNKEEIKKLQEEKKSLDNNKDSLTEENYYREMTLILRYIDLEKTKLAINEKLKNNYDKVLSSIKELKQLTISYTVASQKERPKIEEKINKIKITIDETLALFPPKVKEEIKSSYAKEEAKLKAKEQAMLKLESLKQDLAKVEEEYNSSISSFINIFAEEKREFENKKFTEAEYESFIDKYIKLKETESNRFLTAKALKEKLTTEISEIEDDDDDEGTPGTTPKVDSPVLKELKEEPLVEPIVKINSPLHQKHNKNKVGPKIVPSYAAKEDISNGLVKVTKVILPSPIKEKDEDVVKKSFKAIINDLTKNLKLDPPETTKYTFTNLNTTSEFVDEVRSDKYKYHISHLEPKLLKASPSDISDVIQKVKTNPTIKYRVNLLRERIDRLTDEEIETLIEDYYNKRQDIVLFPTALSVLLDEKIRRYLVNRKS